jgi:CRP-like cAMP-binding protein
VPADIEQRFHCQRSAASHGSQWSLFMINVSSAEKSWALRRSSLFRALAPSDADRLSERLQRRRFADGQLIFSQGDPGSSMMAVLEGNVRIGIASPAGRELTLSIVEPGEVFGELAMLDGKARSANATALGDCVLLTLERRDLLPVLRQSPDAAIHLCEIVCGRVRSTTERIEGASLLSVGARLARLLLQIADRRRRNDGHVAARIDDSLSQSELGRLIGASRQQVNRHLCCWIADGILARDGRALQVRDRDRLLSMAETEE